MQKQYNIRWGRSDYAKLSHLIRKVNKKRFGVEVHRPDIAEYQPDALNYNDIKASIKTRNDLTNTINKYKRYLREGGEEVVKSSRGAKATKWEINEFNIAQRAENVRRANTRKKLEAQEVKIAGKGTGQTRAQMGSIKENEAKPSKKKFNNMSQEEWNRAFKRMDAKMRSTYTDEKRAKMIENYVKGLISEGYSEKLQNLMNKIPQEKFLEVVDTDETATFDFIYDPIELKGKEETLFDLWEQYADENTDNGLNLENLVREVAQSVINK